MSSLFRKYRPQRFADVAEQEHVVKTVTQQITQGSLAQVYLFSGPRGVGKTTIARLLAKSMQCTGRAPESAEACGTCPSCTYAAEGKMMDTIEIDAASQTGVDAVRENIIEGVRFGPSLGKYKVFIIDEVHMLSSASFNALLKTLEEPPKFAVFILATTELHKIPATVLSRCQRFAFTRIPVPAMMERLRTLAQAEGRTVHDAVFMRIARLSEGCLRDAESLLGQVFDSVQGDVTESAAKAALPDSSLSLLNTLITLLAGANAAEAAREVKRASEAGASLRHVHDDFLEYVQAVVFAAWGDDPSTTFDEGTAQTMRSAAEQLGARKAVALLDALLAARVRSAPALMPELPLQVAFFQWEKELAKPEAAPAPTAPRPPVAPAVAQTTQAVPVAAQSTPAPWTVHAPVPDVPAPSEPPVTASAAVAPAAAPTVAPAVTAPAQPAPAQAPAPTPAPAPAPAPVAPPRTLSELEQVVKDKWGRCLDKAKETGPGYALMMSSAEFVGIENGTHIVVAFPYQMHADRLQEPKNAKILLDAITEVCLLPQGMTLKCTKSSRPDEAQEEVQDLLEAFGGSVL